MKSESESNESMNGTLVTNRSRELKELILMGRLTLRTEIERWPLVAPFRITGYTWEALDVLVVSLEKDGHVGRGEAQGVYYRNDNPASMTGQIESLRTTIEAGISRESLQSMLPPGGARNALDCALWDLEAKLSGRPAWQVAEVGNPRPFVDDVYMRGR